MPAPVAVHPPRHSRETRHGIAYVLVGSAALSLSDSFAKSLSPYYPALQLLFMRSALTLPLIVLLLLVVRGPGALVSRTPGVHMLRGITNIFSVYCFYSSLSRVELAQATAIAFCSPVLITVISAFVLRQRVAVSAWLAVFAGFLGVLIVVRPGTGGFQWALLLPLGAAFWYAVTMLLARSIRPDEPMLTTVFYIVLCQMGFSALALWWIWQPVDPAQWAQMTGLSIFGSLGIGCITQAFRLAPPVIVAPLDYTSLLWAGFLGWLVWGEIPPGSFYLGAALIIIAGVYMAMPRSE